VRAHQAGSRTPNPACPRRTAFSVRNSCAPAAASAYPPGVEARGRRLWGLAVDDAHWRRPDHGQGWVVLKARRLEREAVMAALRAGHFYSTRGPRITGIEVFEGAVRVTCSSVATISFICDNWRGKRFRAEGAAGIGRAEFTPPADARYVRVECADQRGRVAWSNPIYWSPSETM
jgi:hypothetical protein